MSGDGKSWALRVNGGLAEVSADPGANLMRALRNQLGLRGVRAGCSIGECGACRILVDGVSRPSCQLTVGDVADSELLTPEGLGRPGGLHPVQQAFVDEQAAQCGYCVNGMISGLTARLSQPGRVTEEELRGVLDDHTCRCGAHVRMLRAARRAAGIPDTGTRPSRTRPGDEVALTGSHMPRALRDQPRIEQWVELRPDGEVTIRSGKVELGQGVRTAFAQIVAAGLDLPVDRVHAAPTVTGVSPDEGQTSGSFSIEHGGTALAMATAALRRRLTERAADRWGVRTEEVRLDAGGVRDPGGRRLTFAELATNGPVGGEVLPTDLPNWSLPPLGDVVARPDLPGKVSGVGAYLQDLWFPGLLHARAVLPESSAAALEKFDPGHARGLDGMVQVVQDGRLILLVADSEEAAVHAQSAVEARTRWGPTEAVVERDVTELLRRLPSSEHVRRRDPDVDDRLGEVAERWSATYTKAYQSHGPMAPSAAVAVVEEDVLRVWTHTQGVYPLRREIAAHLDLDQDGIVIEHVDGPGCYGLTCSDDAALLAAIAALAVPGRPVRLQLSVSQEFTWDPYGSAMVGDLLAGVDEQGAIRAWRYHLRSDSHSTRANGDGDRLLAAWVGSTARDRPWVGQGEPTARNALPLYDVPAMDITGHDVRGPLRTGPLRSLGAFFNVFATESFMDELAERAGADPVEFRLRHLRDPRAAEVLRVASESAGWAPHTGPSGSGLGVAVARYKDTKAYTAMVVQMAVDADAGTLRAVRTVVACDAGTVINPDGVANQLEGGVIQGLSRTLFEEVPLASGHGAFDWSSYARIRFADVPEVEVVLVDRPGAAPLGVGETSTPLVPAAVANAIDDAIGVRLRDLPFTRARLERRLVDLTDEETERVRW